MSLPTSQVPITAGSGTNVATQTISSKEYQVVMLAGDKGHLMGTKPSYMLFIPVQAVGASKIYFDIFNATGTGKKLEFQGMWAIVKTDVAVTGTLGVELQVSRTSAIGTGGTAAVYPSTSFTAAGFTPKDSTNAALPAGVTARLVPTGGATVSAAIWQNYIFTEETNVSSQISQFYNLFPVNTMDSQTFTLNENEGIRVAQGTVASVGSIGFLVDFAVL